MTIVVAARGADDFFLGIQNMSFSCLTRCMSSLGEIYGDWRGRGAVLPRLHAYSVSKFVYITYLLLYISWKGQDDADVLTWHINQFVKI